MKIIIYGAGKTAEDAYTFVGYGRVECFAISESAVPDRKLYSKPIISYEEMLNLYNSEKEYWIVVAADNYWREMEHNLQRDKIANYLIFHSTDCWSINNYMPYLDMHGRRVWRSYAEIVRNLNIKKFRRLCVYGTNEFLKYLLLELKVQVECDEICIVSDTEKGIYLGCKYIHPEDITEYDGLIINIKHNDDDIRNELCDKGRFYYDIYNPDIYEFNLFNYGLGRYKNIHKGKRCFIVATGPSLKIEDLNCLYQHNEICISMNKIYRCYNQTEWRADYVGITDGKVLADIVKDYKQGIEMPKKVFVGDNSIHSERQEMYPNAEYFHLNLMNFEPNLPLFSDDITRGTYRGCTVTYDFALQMAAYMGFSEIYLLGVDHEMSGKISDDNNHFIKNYYTKDEKSDRHFNLSNWDGATKAYQAAEKYSRQHGFRIYNATRGGKLEVFERVDFDRLFDK